MSSEIRRLAKEAAQSFEDAKRENGETFLRLTAGSPEWIADMVREAGHDNAQILPEDWRYQFTYRACEIIADSPDDEDDAEDWALQQLDTSVNVYTSDLLTWLASSTNRLYYLDEAIENREGTKVDSAQILMQAQYAERLEVYEAVLSWLTAHAETISD